MTELEWKTRKQRIDKRLTSLSPSWKIVKYSEGLDTSALSGHAVEEYPTANGPADYAFFVGGKLLGILEAKKVGTGPQEVLGQAKRYSRGVQHGVGRWNGYGVPFLYSSNGEAIWHADVRSEKVISRRLAEFHTADALEEMFNRSDDYSWFDRNDNTIERLRYYQKDAIAASERFIADGKRSMLLAMATGTGKTFTTVAQIYRLLESKTARRILFLVDRRALAAQAVQAFAAFNTPRGNKFIQEYEVYSQKFYREDFDDERPFDPKVLPTNYLTHPQPTHTFVYVSTIQRMAINLLGRDAVMGNPEDPDEDEKDADKIDIPIHAFDVIIADECHRGYTARESGIWRQVIDYFDAIKIGLTATPAAHTVNLFHEVAYRYTTTQAVDDGFLVDYDAVRIKSNVRMNGVFLREGEEVMLVDRETGQETYDQLEDEREFVTAEIEAKVTSPDSNRKIIEEIAGYAKKQEEETGRFPKILIFAANDLPHTSHAEQLVRLCREVFNRGDDFVQKITGAPNVDRPLQRIREFRNRPIPKIVVTVDMLSTGVDIPALEYIVFLRPVKSRILWVQMLGRGTRLCPEIHKDRFTIFDCFDGTLIEYFRKTTDFEIELLQTESVPLKQVIENIYQNKDRPYWTNVLIKRLRRIEHSMSGEATATFEPFIPAGDLASFINGLPRDLRDEFVPTMAILRNPEFQKAILNFPRAKSEFVVGLDVQDQVVSDFVFRKGDLYLKPEDYLESFGRFVRENPEEIQAIRILLEKPREWRTEVLEELRQKLGRAGFAIEHLRKAHHLVYHKAIVDIISMVKHAAVELEPLLTPEERVDRAIQKVTADRQISAEQREWIGYIREHLIQNMTLDEADFDTMPVLARRGGLRAAQRVFNQPIGQIIRDINYAIAA